MTDRVTSLHHALTEILKPLRDLDWKALMMLGGRGADPKAMIAMAFQEMGENAQKIGELNVSPDLLKSLIDIARDGVIQKQIKLDFVVTRPHQQRGVKLLRSRRYQAPVLDSVGGEAQADSTARIATFSILHFSPVDTCHRFDSSSILPVAA